MSSVEKLLKDIEEIANDTPEDVSRASLNEAIDEMREKANFVRLLIESEQVVVVEEYRLKGLIRTIWALRDVKKPFEAYYAEELAYLLERGEDDE